MLICPKCKIFQFCVEKKTYRALPAYVFISPGEVSLKFGHTMNKFVIWLFKSVICFVAGTSVSLHTTVTTSRDTQYTRVAGPTLHLALASYLKSMHVFPKMSPIEVK